MRERVKIAFLNSLGLALDPLLSHCTRQKIDILILTESYRSSGTLPTDWHQHHLFARPNPSTNGQIPGVSILWRRDLPFHVHPLPPHAPHALSVRAGPHTITGVYYPPSLPNTAFREAIEKLPNDPFSITLGDWNVRLGPLVGDTRTNARASIMTEWMANRGLHVWNASLAHGKHTFFRRDHKSVIDFAVSREQDCPAPALEVDDEQLFAADHYLCIFSFLPTQAIPRVPLPNAPRRLWQLDRLDDEDVLAQYVDTFAANLDPFLEDASATRQLQDRHAATASIDALGTRLTQAIHDALDASVMPTTPRPKHWKWFWTPHLQNLADARQHAFVQWKRAPNSIDRLRLWKA
ncbi:Endonuclease/exonuclease/phosphatase [Gongronella butleri]|nr:Endonuclease/exonuclease/phosphatase [Gongronella butleri]